MRENIAQSTELSHAEKEARRRATLVAKGLCYVCARNSVSGKAKDCQACKRRRKQYVARVRARYKSEGKCKCGRCASEGKRNCSICTAKSVLRNRDERKTARQHVINFYGGSCVGCGESDIRVLTLDHVNGDGHVHRRILKDKRSMYVSLYRQLRRAAPITWELQILCFNCHAKKDLTPWWMKD
jgi:hypothetical protein